MNVKHQFRKIAGCGAAALVMLACGASAQAQVVFSEDFGTLENTAARTENDYVTGFSYAATGEVSNNHYAGMRPENVTSAGLYWQNLPVDHTGNTHGALMVLNAGTNEDTIYEREVTLKAGKIYRVSGWRYVVNGDGDTTGANPLNWAFDVSNTSGDIALSEQSGNLPASGRQWTQSTFDFTVTADCSTRGKDVPAKLTITNRTVQNSGNDLYVDDISVEAIGDQALSCPVTPVPTLDFAGLGLLSLLGAGAGALGLRRRKRAQ